MRLAALYRGDPGDAGDARLHVAVDGGFAPVDELAAAARRPDRRVAARWVRSDDLGVPLRPTPPRLIRPPDLHVIIDNRFR